MKLNKMLFIAKDMENTIEKYYRRSSVCIVYDPPKKSEVMDDKKSCICTGLITKTVIGLKSRKITLCVGIFT